MLRQVVPGQLGVVALGWHVAPGAGPACTSRAGKRSHSFPCPSGMLVFICKQLHRGWEPLGKLQPAVLEGKASNKLSPEKS